MNSEPVRAANGSLPLHGPGTRVASRGLPDTVRSRGA